MCIVVFLGSSCCYKGLQEQPWYNLSRAAQESVAKKVKTKNIFEVFDFRIPVIK